jgi:hypothetical protein
MEKQDKKNHKKGKNKKPSQKAVWDGAGDEWPWLEDSNHVFQECLLSCNQNPLWSLGSMPTSRRNACHAELVRRWFSGSFSTGLIVLMFSNSQKAYKLNGG